MSVSSTINQYSIDHETTLILQVISTSCNQPWTVYGRLVANVEPTFVKRRQNSVEVMSSTYQSIFYQILTLKQLSVLAE